MIDNQCLKEGIIPVVTEADHPLAGRPLTLPGQILMPADLDPGDGDWSTGCVICGYPLTDLHHIKPRSWGGQTIPSNLIYLCPNHHAAVHLLMKWWLNGRRLRTSRDWMHLRRCASDTGLCEFWELEVKAVVAARLEERQARNRR